MSDNILLNLGHEPHFDQIRTDNIAPAMRSAMQEARGQIAQIKAQSTDRKSVV